MEPSPDARRDAWAALQAPEPPYGFDPAPIWPGGPDGNDFVAIRLGAWRVELFGPPSVVWKAAAMPHEANSEKGRTP